MLNTPSLLSSAERLLCKDGHFQLIIIIINNKQNLINHSRALSHAIYREKIKYWSDVLFRVKWYVDRGIAHKLLGQPMATASSTSHSHRDTATCQRHCQSHDIAPGHGSTVWSVSSTSSSSSCFPPEQSDDSQGDAKRSHDEEPVNCGRLHVWHYVECKVVEQLQIDRKPIDGLCVCEVGGGQRES